MLRLVIWTQCVMEDQLDLDTQDVVHVAVFI